MSDSTMKRLSGLWIKEKKSGGKMMTGRLNADAIEAIQDLGPCNLLLFKNDRKENDRHPDYYLFAAPAEDRGGNRRREEETRTEREEFF